MRSSRRKCHRAATVANGNDDAWFGRRVVSAFDGGLHVLGDRTRDQQQVCMPRAGGELDANRFEVVVGVVERVDLEFASIA